MLKRLLVVAAMCFACHRGNPIEQRIRAIASAVEDRDADDVASSLSTSFQSDAGFNRQQALDELRRYFFGYRNLSVRLSEVRTVTRDDTASADFLAEVIGNPKTIGGLDQILPRSSRLRFHLELRQESSTWRITSASWKLEESTTSG